MLILHINFDDVCGSAGRMVSALIAATEQQGHAAWLATGRQRASGPRVVPIAPPQTQWSKALRRQQNRLGVHDFSSPALLDVLNHSAFEQADIVHLHRMNNSYYFYLLLPFLAAKPTVWTFHDPAAFTAGCRYTGACQQWRDNWCKECPVKSAAGAPALRRDLLQMLKAAIYQMAEFTAVCPTDRLRGQTQASMVKGHDVRLIPHGVDTSIYRPGDRDEARVRLGLPVDRTIILHISADDLIVPGDDGPLRAVLAKVTSGGPPPLLLDLGPGAGPTRPPCPEATLQRPFTAEQANLADYYRAADLFVSDAVTDSFDLAVAEAMACGLPVVAFAGGGAAEIIAHRQTGYLATNSDSEDLARGIAGYLEDAQAMRRDGELGRTRIIEKFAAGKMTDAYLALYEEMLLTGGGRSVLVWVRDKLPRVLEQSKPTDWPGMWDRFGDLYARFSREEGAERTLFVDEYFKVCLKHTDDAADTVWDIVRLWFVHRRLPHHCGGLSAGERDALLAFCRLAREKIRTHLEHNALSRLAAIDQQEHWVLVNIWRKLFFDYSSILNLNDSPSSLPAGHNESAGCSGPIDYGQMLIASMYHPFAADAYPLTAGDLLGAPLPPAVRMILAYWLANTPYFSLEERHRQKLLACLPILCRMNLPPAYFTQFVTEILNDLWRVSYVGGDNLAPLNAFGDFITRHMERFFPQHAAGVVTPKRNDKKAKIRVGYISRLFYRQAVSYYMVNRIIHHDRDKFEIHIFALGDRQDCMTDLFRQHSEAFKQLADVHDIGSIAACIAASQLDILIFTDIGMDPMTYMLAGLRLAPVQCVLVGHGTTTGMPKIDYYISGDFEPPDADAHYRESLVRLPNLGAAQYPPPFAGDIGRCRKDWNLPDDVVVFVSCANGMKHVPARDEILIRILQEAPNACIVLKPYFSAQEGDIFTKRVMDRAEKAGVGGRLFIIPPLGRVEAVLAIADVQLDTYPYGGWTTNMEALFMGLPVVTQEGAMARSRWGAHMLRALGVSEGIARNDREYVDWAVRFAADAALRHRVQGQIQQKAKTLLFNGAAAQPAYEAALLRIYGRGSGNAR